MAAGMAAGMDRESLMLLGQGGELYMGEDGDGGSAEERIRTLLGDGAAGIARRRIRRPLGGGYAAAQGLAFAESQREGGDSLNELLAHLTATRSGMPSSSRARDAADSNAALTALEKMLAEEDARPSFAQQIVENTPAHARDMALRSRFMQELMLSSMGRGASGRRCCGRRGRRLPAGGRGCGWAVAAGGARQAGGAGPAAARAQRSGQPAGQRLGADVVGRAPDGMRQRMSRSAI